MTNEHMATVGPVEKDSRVNLEILAKMTGFPVEMIKEEIFQGQNTGDVSLEDLRIAMLTYIDSTMMINDIK